ncbi:MAG: 30S ribosome-binding factor RbfA [Clostridiales bacterium]|nr:30S ribosome-binding factor RbfA [Clostridiales bacterium]
MATHRKDRVAEEIKKELSDIIRNEMKDPRIKGLVSVTHVEVSKDLSTATVFLSSLGDEDEHENLVQACKQAGGYLRAELANRLNLRFIPELSFRADHSIQTGARIHALINQQAREIEEAELQRKAMGVDAAESREADATESREEE